MPGDDTLVPLLAAFGRELRTAGVMVGTDDVIAYCAAVSELDPSDILDVYWAGRGTLVSRRDQIAVYDRVFRAFFLDESFDDPTDPRVRLRSSPNASATLELPEPESGRPGTVEVETQLGLVASPVEVMRTKAFASCTPEELAAMRRLMARIRLVPPRRRTRRAVRAPDGPRIDMRRMAREAIQRHGEADRLRFTARRRRIRPLILLLDVSGSMSDHSRNLLQFAHATRRASGRVEVFCFGTRLTRITRELARRRPDEALERAAAAVSDWDGGTRIGEAVDRFVRTWGRRGMSRGAVVVICSDGLDRGEPELLAAAMERLARVCHRVVWMNPHMGDDPDARPSSLGMIVAAPHIDLLMSGHDLASLEGLVAALPALR
jgi:uncharacterized protein with von Willebrand factor type A (vWA) domain